MYDGRLQRETTHSITLVRGQTWWFAHSTNNRNCEVQIREHYILTTAAMYQRCTKKYNYIIISIVWRWNEKSAPMFTKWLRDVIWCDKNSKHDCDVIDKEKRIVEVVEEKCTDKANLPATGLTHIFLNTAAIFSLATRTYTLVAS